MDCFLNYIGIFAPGVSVPPAPPTPAAFSGLYINKDLPISIQEIDAFADAEQETLWTVWDEVQKRGIKKFVNKVQASYRELFGTCFIDSDWFCDNKEALALPLLYFLGMELMIEKIYTTRINRYTRAFDSARAREMREEFTNEFYNHLKDSLMNIGQTEDKGCAADGIFIYYESTP
jgi:hypothetical protein